MKRLLLTILILQTPFFIAGDLSSYLSSASSLPSLNNASSTSSSSDTSSHTDDKSDTTSSTNETSKTTPSKDSSSSSTSIPALPTLVSPKDNSSSSTKPSQQGSQSSATTVDVNETMLPIIHIQNNSTSKGTLTGISVQVSNPKSKNSLVVKGKINVSIPAKEESKKVGPIIAFNPTIQHSPFPPEFNGVKSITVDSSQIEFTKMSSGLNAMNAIKITKINGEWVLEKEEETNKNS